MQQKRNLLGGSSQLYDEGKSQMLLLQKNRHQIQGPYQVSGGQVMGLGGTNSGAVNGMYQAKVKQTLLHAAADTISS